MNYRQEAIAYLKNAVLLKRALRNLDDDINQSIAEQGPSNKMNATYDIAGGHGSKDENTLNNLFKVMQLRQEKENTELAIKKIYSRLNELKMDPYSEEFYSDLLRDIYINNRKPESLIDFYNLSKTAIYNHRDIAIGRFAVLLFGISAIGA